MREDWIECKLVDISYKITDGSHNPPAKNNESGMMMLSARNIFENKIDYDNVRFLSNEDFEIENRRTKVVAGDVLLTIVATIGRSAVVRESDRKFVLQRSVAVIGTYINPYFLNYYLKSQSAQSFLWSNAKGTAQKGIYLKVLSTLPVIISSLPEQRAIVKKLESLFSSLDAGIADLKKAQQQLKIYRQAVLKKAFENIKSEISLEEIKQDSLIGLVKSNAEQNATIGVPYIKMNNINMDGGTDIKNVVYVDASASEIEKYSLLKGDILINTRNSFELVGKSGIIKSDLSNYTFNNNLMRLRLKSGINPFFVFYQIIGPSMRKMMVAEKKATTSICALYQRDIFPLKAKMIENIEEQNEIVKQIESRLSVCDSIEQNIKESLEKSEALRQSILKKAFEGNLLTAQELAECKLAEDYEPASVLLKRIKAEQNKASAKPSKKKVAQPLVVAKIETPVVKVSADIHAGLIAKVIKIHEENPASIENLSHIKCEKIAHLVEYHLQIPLGRQPVKDAAGPDDYPHLKKIEHRAKMAGYFAIQKKEIGYSYSSAKNSDKAIEKFQSVLSDEKNKQLDDLIALFLKFDLEVSEIIATTYAGWNNLILNGNANPSDEEIVYESRENWSERKLKIARERFFKAIEWMRKNEIVPTGYGAVVPFPKKKK